MDRPLHADTEKLRAWSDRLQASARTGLFFAGSDYDRERYQEIISIAAEMAALGTGRSPVEIQKIWVSDLGYVTPRVGVGAVIFNDAHEILLLQRPESGLWSIPVGFSEVGESPAAGIVREVHEETGLLVKPERLLGIYDCQGGPWLLHHLYNIVFRCTVQSGTLVATTEAPTGAYFGRDALPDVLPHHAPSIADAFAAQTCTCSGAAFDRPSLRSE